jgi:hypothetical protein
MATALNNESVQAADREYKRRNPGARGRPKPGGGPEEKRRAQQWSALYANAEAARRARQGAQPVKGTTLPCQAKPSCELATLALHCSHHPAKRPYQLKFPAPPPAAGKPSVPTSRTLSVVAGATKELDKITVTTTAKQPLCNAHEHRAKHFRVTHASASHTYAAPAASFDVASSLVLPTATSALQRAKILYQYVWPKGPSPARYTVEALACGSGGIPTIVVDVYPALEWNVSVSFGVSAGHSGAPRTLREDPDLHNRDLKGKDIDAGFAFEVKASYKYQGVQEDLGFGFKQEYSRSSTWLNTVRGSKRWLNKLCELAGNVTITFPEIKTEISYKSAVIEQKDDWTVDPQGTLIMKADPLIGGSIEVDLLELLIAGAGAAAAGTGVGVVMGPRIAQLLIKVKRALAEGLTDDPNARFNLQAICALTLNMAGGIIAEGKVVWTAGKQTDAIGRIGGKIEFKFGGQASVEGKAMIFKAYAGVKLTGSAGFIGTMGLGADAKGAYWQGRLGFNGAKLEFQSFAGVKVERKPPTGQTVKSDPQGKSGWTVSINPWPAENAFQKHYLF